MQETETENRALATIATIDKIEPIDGADQIKVATIRGWQVVVRVDENLKPGDPVVYFEIDSHLPATDQRFRFLTTKSCRNDKNDELAATTNPDHPIFKGHRLRTIKLRGQVSQGLALPLASFPELAGLGPVGDIVGTDVTEQLGIRLWDPPLPADLAGVAKGTLPAFVTKTNATRVQNIKLEKIPDRDNWVCSEKLDGTSTTFYHHPDEGFGVTGRNYDLVEGDQTPWQIARSLLIPQRLASLAPGKIVVAQGELCGPGIQSNPLKLKEPEWFCFRLTIDGEDVTFHGLGLWSNVPLLDIPLPSTNVEALELADNLTSAFKGRPEGLVWRYYGDNPGVTTRCIKAISNRTLLKEKD